MTIAEIFDKGGIVVWVLLAYSFLAMVIVAERVIHYLIMGQPVKDFENRLLNAIQKNSLEKELATMKGPEARLMQGIYSAKLKNIKDLQSVASRYGSAELQSMERGFRTLSILGHTAPLLGLLGTIMGMIKAFMVIEMAGGQVDAQALAGGIWEAMLTTGVGLAVAIPILLLLHLLEGVADRRAHSMRCYSMLLLEHLPHEDHQQLQADAEASHHRKGVIHAV
jgi:biopolymer transport protein ExbB